MCPSEPTTFTCTVIDDSNGRTTVWKGNSSVFDCQGNSIKLRHTIEMNNDMCGAASARLEPPDNTSYTSVLTIVPTLEMDGSKIQCAFPSTANIKGEGILNVIGKFCIANGHCMFYTVLKSTKCVNECRHKH